MKKITQTIALSFVLLLPASLPILGDPFGQTLHIALGADGTVATEAVQKLRSKGQEGVDALLAAEPVPGTPAHQHWAGVLDTVCAQRDCAASSLYWHTEIEAALAAAEKTGRPILSLRLLGRLDEEVSCANSRFFRSVLYSDPRIAKVLRKRFVLYWESVRPVPRITIDYGDGRALHGTITGNSIHYILDSKGRLVDALPGLYGPGLFQDLLGDAENAALNFAKLRDEQYITALRKLHIDALLARELEFAHQGGLHALLARAPSASGRVPTAFEAGLNAVSKSRGEQPLVEAISLQGGVQIAEDPFDWSALAKRHRSDWRLSTESRRLIRTKHLAATGAVDNNLLDSFERVLSLDTVRNEFLLHTVIHAWLAQTDDAVPDLAAFNNKVYADLFLTPKSDPWLGLRSPETYLALAPVGEAAR